MNKRVMGIIGIGADKANWNADFSGNPHRCGEDYVGSPFSLKFCYRHFWDLKGLKVLGKKTFKEKKDKEKGLILVPKTLEERIKDCISDFNVKEHKKSQRKLFDFIDVSCFGATIALTNFNKSYTGVIQFGMGVNKYEYAQVERDSLLSPYQNSSKEEKKGKEEEKMQSTTGARYYLDEAHFFYDFVIEPKNYDFIKEVDDEFIGFTDEDYKNFKEASLVCVNNYNSVSKKSCFNEFAMFVTLKEGSLKFLGNLVNDVIFVKGTSKNDIDLTRVMQQLNEIKDDIEKIEIYYNPFTTVIKGHDIMPVELKNILRGV